MLFSSMTFIYLFLPIVFLIYFLLDKKYRNTVLLIASIIFYAWGEPNYLAVMLFTILINYFGALLLVKFSKYKKQFLVLTIILNLLNLIYFKYFNFIIDNINNLFNSHISVLHVVLPLGISFYTFQALSYVIDVYRGECKLQTNIYMLALYICLFPQLIAGPIVKYHDISQQLVEREINLVMLKEGVQRFIIGLSKKVLIANTMGLIADKVFSQAPYAFSPLFAWLGAISYSFQIFFDFSGYSDMAIGLGLIFGFRFMENFNYPYISKSISEFWRRWHISLSTWFKQYVYIPLGGNRHGLKRTCLNLGIVFLLTGIWHGASWNFIVWGIWNGFFIILEKIVDIKSLEQKYSNIFIKILQHIYCISIFIIGWVFFRAENISYALSYIRNMFGLLHVSSINYPLLYYVDNVQIITFVFALLLSIPIMRNKYIIKAKDSLLGNWVFCTVLLGLLFLSTINIAIATYNPFIYFRF